MAGNVANRTVKITYEFEQRNAQVARNVSKLVKGTTHNFKGLSHGMKQSNSVFGKVITSFKSFHMELLGLGFGFAMIGMIFSGFVTKALNEYMKLTKWGDALGMSWLNMQGAIKTLGFHIIDFASETLEMMFGGIEKAIDQFMAFDSSVNGAASSTLVLVGAVALVLSPLAFLGLFLFSVGQLLIKTITFIGSMTVAAGGLKASLSLLAKAVAVIGVFLFAVWGILEHFNKNIGTSTEEVDLFSVALGVLNWITSLVIVAMMGFVTALIKVGDRIGTVMRIQLRFQELISKAFYQLADVVTRAFGVMIAAALDFFDTLIGKEGNRSKQALIDFGNSAITMAGMVSEGMRIVNEEFALSAQRLAWMTEEGSAWGDMMKSALSTVSGGAVFPNFAEQIAAATPQVAETAAGLPTAPTTAGFEYPQAMEDFLKGRGGLGAVDVNIKVEDQTTGGITVRGEVLTESERMLTTLIQEGV